MGDLIKRAVARPRMFVSLFAGIGVAVLGTTWAYQYFSRCASAYAYVRGQVVLVGAPMEGQIAAIEVEPGRRVKRGEVLARLTDGGLRAEVERAKAAHERAKLVVVAEKQSLEVERRRLASTRERLTAAVEAARARRSAAQATALHAERAAGRAGRLVLAKALATADQDNADSLAETLRSDFAWRAAEVKSAEAELAGLAVSQAELAARVDRLALLEADVESARAALAAAEGRLDLTVIRAQDDGRVNRLILAPGASLRVGEPLIEMWLDTPLSVEAWIDEDKLARLRRDGKVRVSFKGLPGSYAGTIQSIGMVSDEEVKRVSVTIPVGNRLAKSRWVRVGITLDRPEERLMPGVTAEVWLP